MKGIRVLFLAVGCIYFILGFVCLRQAQGDSTIAEYLSQQGKVLYEKGNISDAIHQLSKALLVDSNNKLAKEYLKKIGLDEGLYGRSTTPLMRVTQMTEGLKMLKGEVLDLQEENKIKGLRTKQLQDDKSKLCDILDMEKEEMNTLAIRNSILKSDLNERDDVVNHIKQIYSKKEVEADHLQKSLEHYEDQLLKKDQILRIKNMDIQNSKDEAIFAEAKLLKREIEFEKRIAQLKEQYLNKANEAKELNNLLFELENQLAGQLSILDKKDHELTEIDKKISKMKVQPRPVEDQSPKVAEKSQSQDNRQDFSQEKNASKDEIESLRKLLAEKEKEIAQFKDATTLQEKQLAKIDNLIKEDQLVKMDKITTQAPLMEEQEKVKFLKKQDQYIAELKEKFAKTNQQLNDLLHSSAQTDEVKVTILRKEIGELKSQISEQENSLQEKNSEIQLLGERLADAQQQLGLAKKVIKEREDQVKDLEKQLNQLQGGT